MHTYRSKFVGAVSWEGIMMDVDVVCLIPTFWFLVCFPLMEDLFFIHLYGSTCKGFSAVPFSDSESLTNFVLLLPHNSPLYLLLFPIPIFTTFISTPLN